MVADIHEPDCVRSEQPHSTGRAFQVVLPLLSLRAAFGEAAREHDGGAGADGGKLPHGIDDLGCADQHDGRVGWLRQRRDVRIATVAADLLVARIDRIDIAVEAVFLQIGERPPG